MSRYVDLDGVSWDGKPITSKIQEVQTKQGYLQGITVGWLWGDNVPHIDLEEHDKNIIEQYKENTKLKDTIKDIHDNVAHEMYFKAIDDFVHIVKEHDYIVSDIFNNRDYGVFTIEIEQIAEKLKAGVNHEI